MRPDYVNAFDANKCADMLDWSNRYSNKEHPIKRRFALASTLGAIALTAPIRRIAQVVEALGLGVANFVGAPFHPECSVKDGLECSVRVIGRLVGLVFICPLEVLAEGVASVAALLVPTPSEKITEFSKNTRQISIPEDTLRKRFFGDFI